MHKEDLRSSQALEAGVELSGDCLALIYGGQVPEIVTGVQDIVSGAVDVVNGAMSRLQGS
jgi:hypothetical protein